MLQEGIIAGVPVLEIDDWTWGEMRAAIRADRERQKRRGQDLAAVAAGGARFVAAYLGSGKVPDLADVFPFWSEEERKQMQLNKYKKMMERLAGGGVKNA